MAIVFDTKAELEAFCEAFELRSLQNERPLRKARRRAARQERFVDVPEPETSGFEKSHPLELVPVVQAADVDALPQPEPVEELPVVLASAS